MTARSYDEFRQLVACAEDDQKPVSSAEMESLGKTRGINPDFNKVVNTTQHSPASVLQSRLGTLALARDSSRSKCPLAPEAALPQAIPRTEGEFNRDWGRLRAAGRKARWEPESTRNGVR